MKISTVELLYAFEGKKKFLFFETIMALLAQVPINMLKDFASNLWSRKTYIIEIIGSLKHFQEQNARNMFFWIFLASC